MRKRKVTYPAPKTATRQDRSTGLSSDSRYQRMTVASIDVRALAGRDDLSVGNRVKIGGEGLFAGDLGVVLALNAGVIPAATVRLAGGQTRRVRLIDLEVVPNEALTDPD